MRYPKKTESRQDLEFNFQVCLKLSQVIPNLFQIAIEKDLKLNRARDFKTIVQLYKSST